MGSLCTKSKKPKPKPKPKNQYLPVPQYDRIALKNTFFTNDEIDYLYVRFRKLGARNGRYGYLAKSDFAFLTGDLNIPIIKTMFAHRYFISFVDFVLYLNNFRLPPPDTSEDDLDMLRLKKLRLIFSLYDLDDDGYVTKSEVLDMVHRLFSEFTDIRTMTFMVRRMFQELRKSELGYFNFDDFCSAMDNFDLDSVAIQFPVLRK